MGKLTDTSARQQVFRLGIKGAVVFPIERFDYITSLVYRVGKVTSRRFTCMTIDNFVVVTRIF